MPIDTEPSRVRYVDAVDFGANALAWMVVVHASGHVVLTVEGLPFARVEPIGARIPEVVVERSQASKMT